MSILYQPTKSLDIIFFTSTNTDMQQSFDFTGAAPLYRQRDSLSQNFIKKNISYNVVVSLLATNQVEPICISHSSDKSTLAFYNI